MSRLKAIDNLIFITRRINVLIVRMTMFFFSSKFIVSTQRTLITITYLTYVTVITQLTIRYLDYLQFSTCTVYGTYTAYHTILTYAAYNTVIYLLLLIITVQKYKQNGYLRIRNTITNTIQN